MAKQTPTQKKIDKLTKAYAAGVEALIRTNILEEARDEVLGIFGKTTEGKRAAQNGAAKKAVKTRKKNGKTAKKAAPAKKKVGAKRSPKKLAALQNRVLKAIKNNPGSNAEELAKKLRITQTRDMSLPLKKLCEAKAIRKKGARRDTRYWPTKRK